MVSFNSGADLKPKQQYITAIKEVFNADPYKDDFSDSKKAILDINKWVYRHTNKKIRKLMPPGTIIFMTSFSLAKYYCNLRYVLHCSTVKMQ